MVPYSISASRYVPLGAGRWSRGHARSSLEVRLAASLRPLVSSVDSRLGVPGDRGRGRRRASPASLPPPSVSGRFGYYSRALADAPLECVRCRALSLFLLRARSRAVARPRRRLFRVYRSMFSAKKIRLSNGGRFAKTSGVVGKVTSSVAYSTVFPRKFCAESRLRERSTSRRACSRARTRYGVLRGGISGVEISSSEVESRKTVASRNVWNRVVPDSVSGVGETLLDPSIEHAPHGSHSRSPPRGPEAALRSYLSVPRSHGDGGRGVVRPLVAPRRKSAVRVSCGDRMSLYSIYKVFRANSRSPSELFSHFWPARRRESRERARSLSGVCSSSVLLSSRMSVGSAGSLLISIRACFRFGDLVVGSS